MNKIIKEYVERTFTEKGYNTLFDYLKQLIVLNYEVSSFPYTRKGKILGMPDSGFFKYYANKAELVGQIKMLMNILGVVGLEVVLSDGSKKVFRFIKED